MQSRSAFAEGSLTTSSALGVRHQDCQYAAATCYSAYRLPSAVIGRASSPLCGSTFGVTRTLVVNLKLCAPLLG